MRWSGSRPVGLSSGRGSSARMFGWERRKQASRLRYFSGVSRSRICRRRTGIKSSPWLPPLPLIKTKRIDALGNEGCSAISRNNHEERSRSECATLEGMKRRALLLGGAAPVCPLLVAQSDNYKLEAEMRADLMAFKGVWDAWTQELVEGKKDRKLELKLRGRWKGVEKWLIKE